jgi:antitoxin (DNA-binding transcriptional repressor) of toxin-antitoxin stability system
MISTGIREPNTNLSHYVREIEAGKRIAVTAHGRVVAELVAAGIIEPAAKPDALPPEWPDIRLPPGTAAELIDSDRGEPQSDSIGSPRDPPLERISSPPSTPWAPAVRATKEAQSRNR